MPGTSRRARRSDEDKPFSFSLSLSFSFPLLVLVEPPRLEEVRGEPGGDDDPASTPPRLDLLLSFFGLLLPSTSSTSLHPT